MPYIVQHVSEVTGEKVELALLPAVGSVPYIVQPVSEVTGEKVELALLPAVGSVPYIVQHVSEVTAEEHSQLTIDELGQLSLGTKSHYCAKRIPLWPTKRQLSSNVGRMCLH